MNQYKTISKIDKDVDNLIRHIELLEQADTDKVRKALARIRDIILQANKQRQVID